MANFIETQIDELRAVLESAKVLAPEIEKAALYASECINNGGTIFSCGNGGSAADAMHLAEELSGRYKNNRKALRGLALNADPTAITCIANDFGYDNLFSRQLEAFGKEGDLLVLFSSSGNSKNQLNAIEQAKQMGVKTFLVTGKSGGICKGKADFEIVVPSNTGARVQEVHTMVLHILIEYIEKNLK